MNSEEMIHATLDILDCNLCGEPYQTPPLPFIFNPGSECLVIAQNPGLVQGQHEYNFFDSVKGMEADERAVEVLCWYRYQFQKSRAYDMLGRLYFGKDWLEFNSRFSFTNIVRCRTKENARPPQVWADTCTVHTIKLLKHFKKVVLVGGLARDTFDSTLRWNTVDKTRRGNFIVCVKHYSAFQRDSEVKNARKALEHLYAL